MQEKFGAFIITYERPAIIGATINALLQQTRPPEQIVVIDNSESGTTKELIEQLADSRIRYYCVGYNSGPAGGAFYGLRILAEDGYDWIYWGDDDDPPKRQDCFEKLLSGVVNLNKPGIVGAVGHRFDRKTGIIRRMGDQELQDASWIEVDVVAGGMCLIANGEMVRKNILPNPELFFGFEDLDFCLKARSGGYRIYANGELFRYYRQNSKRPLAYAGKRGLRKADGALWRDYYSMRNLLYLFLANGFYRAVISQYIRILGKIVYNFRFGLGYGQRSAKLAISAITDFHSKKLGKR
jgi:Predicted glycosyltransferases